MLDEAFLLLRDHGVKVQSPEALDLLFAAGARADDDVALPAPRPSRVPPSRPSRASSICTTAPASRR